MAGRTAPARSPPWNSGSAGAAHAAPGDQAALGAAAHARGLYRDAAQLHKNAAASGNPRAVSYLSRPPACLRADPRPAHWAAAHAALNDPVGAAFLLDSLRQAGAHEQAAALAARAAAHAALNDPRGVAFLLNSLRQAGAHEQAAALTDRLSAVGMFGLFLEQRKGLADRFRFGQEADGTPAAPWGWEDLALWLVARSRGQAPPAQH